MLPLYRSFSCGPPEFKPIMDNNHITARYIKDLAYRSVGSHSGTFQKSIHSRALTGSMLCIKCVTQESVFWAIWFPNRTATVAAAAAAAAAAHCTGFIKKDEQKNKQWRKQRWENGSIMTQSIKYY